MQQIKQKVLTIEQAEQLLQERHPQLRIERLETDEARAALQQERLLENPEADLLYNVYNPLSHRYFDAGREGEMDISLSQPISIRGQRKERIRRQEAVVAQTESGLKWTTWTLRMDLHRTMADVFLLQEKLETFRTEIMSAENIIRAWKGQSELGNVSRMEVMRMEAFKLRLLGDQNAVAEELAKGMKDLRRMLGMALDEEFIVKINLQQFPTIVERVADDALSLRADMEAHSFMVKAATHDLRLQRANALPHVGLKAEYDKNGNICRNFWGVGFSVSIPLFNRNQGSIRQAAIALERAKLEEEVARCQAEADLALCYDQLNRKGRLLEEAQRMSLNDFQPEALEQQLLSRNISYLEYIDLYDAWRDAHIQLLEAWHGMLLSAIDLNEKSGKELINIY